MKRIMLVVVALFAFGLFTTGCKGKLKEKLAQEAEKAAKEQLGVEEGAGCDAYEKCCNAYLKALESVKGAPESVVESAKKGCESIAQMKKAPGADIACAKAMEVMVNSMASLENLPGFETPEECE
jgi:hypothetical protein